MFAIVRTGGKQYRVAAGDKIVVEKLDGEAGSNVTLGDVLLAGEGSELKSVEGLTVSAEIIAQAKGEKVIVFKKRRRHNYRRKNGHRQQHTILKITAIGDKRAGILQNHGLITLGQSIEQAIVDMLDLERSCEINLGLLAAWDDVIEVPREAALQAREIFKNPIRVLLQWNALVRQVGRAG